MDFRLQFDRPFICQRLGPNDAGVRVCDVVSDWLYSRGRARAHTLVMALDWTACWMDFWERHFQLAGASANGRSPLAGKQFACWNYPAGRSRADMDNDANLAEI